MRKACLAWLRIAIFGAFAFSMARLLVTVGQQAGALLESVGPAAVAAYLVLMAAGAWWLFR